MPSLLSKSVLQSLKQAFPNTRINSEYYVNYEGSKLFFDFHLPTLRLLVEVQGVQHTEFSPHFHGTAEVFKAAQKRDRLKKEWCDIHDLTLVCLDHTEIPIEVPCLLKKIEEAQHNGS